MDNKKDNQNSLPHKSRFKEDKNKSKNKKHKKLKIFIIVIAIMLIIVIAIISATHFYINSKLGKLQIEQITNEIVANATGSRYDKILYVHDWIVDNVEYDNDNTINNDNIYGTFVNKKVVCEGYAEALKYLLDKLNIPCVLVYGNGYDDEGNVEAHAWNYVKMEDGNWYAIDTTWDDPLYIGGSNSITQNLYKHTYFLKGSKSFNRNHVSDGDVSGTGQDFKYPELSENDYN